MNTNRVNPWSVSLADGLDYDGLKKAFCPGNFKFKMRGNFAPAENNMIIGQERFRAWLEAANENKKVALVSGFMPSGDIHLGSFATILQMAYYQKNYKTKLFIPIADLEAIRVRHAGKKLIRKEVARFLAHFYAAGIEIEKSKIYLQTRESRLIKQARKFMSKIKIAEMNQIYARKLSEGEALSSMVMATDILYPQLFSYKKTLVVLGIDEASHFVLVKELIKRLGEPFELPSITYHKIISGLNEGKMSKSISESNIKVIDSSEAVTKKLSTLLGKRLPLAANPGIDILHWYGGEKSRLKEVLEEKDASIASDKALKYAIELLSERLPEYQERYYSFINTAEEMATDFYKVGSHE